MNDDELPEGRIERMLRAAGDIPPGDPDWQARVFARIERRRNRWYRRLWRWLRGRP